MYYYALPLLIVLTVLIVLFCVNCIVINCTNLLFPGRGQAPSPDPTLSCTTILHTSPGGDIVYSVLALELAGAGSNREHLGHFFSFYSKSVTGLGLGEV